jgi:hypothetical protein
MRDLFEEQNRILVSQHRELMAFLCGFRCGSGGEAATKHDLKELEKKIMATQAELTTQLAATTAKVTKIGTETRTLLDKITALQTAIDNMPAGTVTPELQAAADALDAQVTVVDDLVPDAPAQPPTT